MFFSKRLGSCGQGVIWEQTANVDAGPLALQSNDLIFSINFGYFGFLMILEAFITYNARSKIFVKLLITRSQLPRII